MKIKCIAIDDEPLALEQIGSYVQKTPFLELIATCKNAYEALDILKEKGYPIARRTVAKYREQLNIPVARLRKEL